GFPSAEEGYPAREYLFPPRHLLRRAVDTAWLPPIIRNLYRQVHLALRSELRTLAGVGIRATIEAVCEQKNAVGKNLFDRIRNLNETGLITNEYVDIFHAQRLLGNDAAHRCAEPNDNELTAAMDVLDGILNMLYVVP